MTAPREPLVDHALIAEQLGDLPAGVLAEILAAFAADCERCARDLLAATAEGDVVAAGRARHALRGICGNFGAARLIAAAEGTLQNEADRAAFRAVMARTLDAVGVAVVNLGGQ